MCDSENNDFPKYLINRTPSRRRYTYIGGAGLPDLKHPVYQISQNRRNLHYPRLYQIGSCRRTRGPLVSE